MRTTRKELESVLAHTARMAGAHVATSYNDVGGWELDHDIAGYRLNVVMSEHGGVRDVSPRLSAGDMALYLRGMRDGLEEARRAKGGAS